jgi:prevent-host-death family protein
MKTITIEDAQANFDQDLAKVEAGETLIITVDGVPIARFMPPVESKTDKVSSEPCYV